MTLAKLIGIRGAIEDFSTTALRDRLEEEGSLLPSSGMSSQLIRREFLDLLLLEPPTTAVEAVAAEPGLRKR